MKKTPDFNTLYSKEHEDTIMHSLQTLCGKESFRPKLDHLKELLSEDIDYIEKKCSVIVVGGTNGKGGTCHHLKNLLEQDKKKVTLWTSPHVLSIRERFYYSDGHISYDEMTLIIDKYNKVAANHELSFYEYLFFIYIKWVRTLDLDYVILEVGLGGRFDGVNIFKNPLCAIVSISLDHTEILGDDLKSILFEKYGITRVGGRLISGIEQKFLVETLKEWTNRDGISLKEIERHEHSYEISNQRLALALSQELGVQLTDEIVAEYHNEIVSSGSKGRREKMTINARDLIFIGAHNFDGIKKMLAELYELGERNLIFVLGFSSGKEKWLKPITKLFEGYKCVHENIFLSDFDHPRAIDPNLFDNLEGIQVIKMKDNENETDLNWEKLLTDEQYRAKKIIISGSYFFIGEWQKFIMDSHHLSINN